MIKLLPLAIAAIGISAAVLPLQAEPQIVILSGDADGNISPCGCTKPMTGGIKRRIQAVKELSVVGRTTLLDNGNLVAGITRQDQMKAQTMAEILGAAGWDAINVGPSDAKLGLGLLLSMNSLSRGKLIASQLPPNATTDIQQFAISPPFLIIGVAAESQSIGMPLGQIARTSEAAIEEGIQRAKAAELTPILLLQGNREESLRLASKYPDLRLIQYRSVGSPGEQLEMAGNTALASTGSDGKYVIRMQFENGKFTNYKSYALGPQYKDEPTATRLYNAYLSRVSTENLLEKMPRTSKVAFSGTSKCGTCHKEDLKIWQHSLHAKGLQTLVKEKHDRDPECLPCHVVGLNSTRGFSSPKKTPDLVGIGCESCHGAGVPHSAAPKKVRMPKVTASNCTVCHTPNTSPNFSFTPYWNKIKH